MDALFTGLTLLNNSPIGWKQYVVGKHLVQVHKKDSKQHPRFI